jgi:hypothetical protein
MLNKEAVLEAIRDQAKKGGGKIAYFEDIQDSIGNGPSIQLKQCIKELKEINAVHYFGCIEDCTQIILKN